MSNLEERLGGGVLNPLAELQGEPATMEEAWAAYEQGMADFEEGQVVPGTIVGLLGEVVLVDIGWKSEGVVPKHEWSEPDSITVGQPVDVLIERTENDSGMIEVSKTKADRIKNWARIQRMYEDGDTIEGKIIKKVKGGLKVDIGLDAFLPASQVARRPTADLDQFLGKSLNFKIIKLTKRRRNVVLSRRQVLEEERSEEKARLLATIQIGMKLEGMVKNITEFGAFVDVGGIDGLLHITDMSWGRVKHPSELLKVGQDLEVVVLSFDKETEKISLGLKQLSENPWSVAAEKYPVNSTVSGKVVSMTDYGAFVELERGVEGMVHVSEMSWTKRVRHPSEVVSIAQEIEVRVLSVDDDNQKISLGIKQVGVNPWEEAAVKYPVGSSVTGRVRNLTDYGAFVELEDGIEGLLHVSDMSWTKKIGHPKELLETGGEVTVKVLNVDVANEKISLGMKQLEDDPWQDVVSRFKQGASLKTTISKLVSFGAFAELGEGVEGLIHISELSSDRVTKPEDAVNIGDEVTVKVISIDPTARKIGLSIRAHKEDEARKAMSSHTEKQGEFANTAMGEAFAGINLPGEEAAAETSAPEAEEAAPAAEAEAETADAADTADDSDTKDTITE